MAVKTRIKIDSSYDDVKKLVDDLNGIMGMLANYERLSNAEKEFGSYCSNSWNFTNPYMDMDAGKVEVKEMINKRIIRYINNPSNDNTYRAEELMEDTDDGELIY